MCIRCVGTTLGCIRIPHLIVRRKTCERKCWYTRTFRKPLNCSSYLRLAKSVSRFAKCECVKCFCVLSCVRPLSTQPTPPTKTGFCWQSDRDRGALCWGTKCFDVAILRFLGFCWRFFCCCCCWCSINYIAVGGNEQHHNQKRWSYEMWFDSIWVICYSLWMKWGFVLEIWMNAHSIDSFMSSSM